VVLRQSILEGGYEMGRAYNTNRGQEECIYDIGVKARRKETTGKTKM
jgi:hypothetical protein